MKPIILGFASTLISGAITVPASAEIPAQQKLLAKRAAELDAYRKLAEQIIGLQITATSTVQDFVTESDRIATHIDEFIKGVRFTDVRYYDDGSCEADAEVTIQQVVTRLKRVVNEVYEGDRWTKDSFEEIRKRTTRNVIQVTGCGAVREESQIPDPAGEPIMGPLVRHDSRPISLPPIYRKYPPVERLKAKRAAELDAYRKLMERIYGLQINSRTLVRDFVTETDRIRTATEGRLKGVRTSSIRYAPDGVVEVEMQVTIHQVITTCKKVYDDVYRGGKWEKDHFDEIKRRTRRKVISVLGTGALDIERDGDEDFVDIDEGDSVIVVE